MAPGFVRDRTKTDHTPQLRASTGVLKALESRRVDAIGGLGNAMNNDAEKIVDLRRYRERHARTPMQRPARLRAAPVRPEFIVIPVPIPVIWFPWWTMVLTTAWFAP